MTDLVHIRRALVQKLESLQRSGVRCVPAPKLGLANFLPSTSPASPEIATHSGQPPTTQQPGTQTAANTESHKSRPAPVTSLANAELPSTERTSALAVLAKEVAGCTLCEQLASTRTQTVFGVGNPNARLVFFGEAPGADEDRQGEPFVGKAGQLLTKIVEACTLTREDVYIMNVLRCRPPGNRNPTPEEAANCRPFFEKQLEIIRPEFICCLGSIAATTLLETTQPVGRLRGQFHDWRGCKVVVTYHPAYLLRNAPAKKYVWADMKMLMQAMGIEL